MLSFLSSAVGFACGPLTLRCVLVQGEIVVLREKGGKFGQFSGSLKVYILG